MESCILREITNSHLKVVDNVIPKILDVCCSKSCKFRCGLLNLYVVGMSRKLIRILGHSVSSSYLDIIHNARLRCSRSWLKGDPISKDLLFDLNH